MVIEDVARDDDRAPSADRAAAKDVSDAAVSLDADAPDAPELDGAPGVVDVPDVIDAPEAVDVFDAVSMADVVDAPVDVGPPPCPSGQTRCGDACVETGNSVANCGACGMACSARDNAAPTCAMGACGFTCNAGFADCDGNASNGCEVALDRAESCGACGTRCQGGTPLCQDNGGRYGCVSGCSGVASTRCGMSCVDLQNDVQHCGGCDRGCAVPPNGRATCAAGTCGIACNMGYHACGTSCADDGAVATCGTRCTPCPTPANATPTCAMGACGFTCNPGFADCDGNAANGCEVDTRTSTTSCGMCGRRCGPYNNADHVCVAGACAIAMCQGATGDCNNNIADGCETPLGNNVAHCGRCGNVCPTRPNATTACSAGTCGFTCATGFADCDGDASNGCEVDTRSSATHCGMCGRSCSAAMNAAAACASGTCSLTCSPGFGDCDGNATNGCETDTRSNDDHCGGCGVVCGSEAICRSGTCAPVQRSCQGSVEGCGTTVITGGVYEMGGRPDCVAASSDPACVSNALNRSGVVVSSFRLDAYEVTVDRFRQFWAQRASDLPAVRAAPVVYPGGETIAWSATASTPGSQSATCNWSPTQPTRLAHPMNCIDWWAAQEFCAWDGGRLPTEAEWEYAARGRGVSPLVRGRLYPWGDTPPSTTCDRAHWAGDGCPGDDGARTRRVGSFAPSAGLYDLAGNVQEWTADRLLRTEQSSCRSLPSIDPLCADATLSNMAVRGGDYVNPLNLLRSASRNDGNPASTYGVVGFRCARRAPTPRPLAPLSTARTASRRPALRVDLGGWPAARVELCRDRACTMVEERIDVVGRQARPSTDLAPGVHFWRIFGRDGGETSRPSPTWEFFVGARSATVDASWGSIADFNGDGRPDLAVSAPQYASNTGRVYIYLGTASGLASSPTTVVTGPDGVGGGYGNYLTSVVSGGDVNGDGFADLLVSAATARSNAGRLYVYLGGPSSIASTPSAVVESPDGAGAHFGAAIAAASDFNGDGFADVAVGASNAASGTGRVHIFLGSPTGLEAVPASTYTHPSGASTNFGVAIAAGDVNGDGLGDIAVGAVSFDGGRGEARLFLGNARASLATPDATFSRAEARGFGGAAAAAGDVNGDGYADLIVGAYGYDGNAYVYLGGATGLAVQTPIRLPGNMGSDAQFGGAVAGVGDVNGDGFDDVTVRAHTAQGTTGTAMLYPGAPSGPSPTPSLTLTGPDGAGGYFGYSTAGAADFNGDGFSDVPISAYGYAGGTGRVYLFPGSSTGLRAMPLMVLTGPDGVGTNFGISVASAVTIPRGRGFAAWPLIATTTLNRAPGSIAGSRVCGGRC